MRSLIIRVMWLFLALGIIPVPAYAAAACGGDFGTWLQGIKQEAATDGRLAAHDPVGAWRTSLTTRPSSRATTPRACSGRASSSSPAAWCRRGSRARG